MGCRLFGMKIPKNLHLCKRFYNLFYCYSIYYLLFGEPYVDINKQAEEFLGQQSKTDERVFAGFRYNSQTLLELKRWCMLAGITKDVTFHSGRHTFAVIMLDLGADIYTVSKLLGHKELKTTQIYAKVLDKKKQEAINLIPDIN